MKRLALALACVIVTAAIVPRAICSRRAAGFFAGDLATEGALATAVAARAEAGVRPSDIRTGSAHFDGEWALVTNQMTVLGLGQIALRHPGSKARWLPAIRAAVEHMLEPEARAFGTKSWEEDGLSRASLAGENGHVYLGYLNLALSMQRLVDAGMPAEHREINDALTAAFVRRLDAAPHGLIETFPGVTFPVDVASAVGSIGLHARATKTPMPPVVARWSEHIRKGFVGKSGFLAQTGDPASGRAGKPRGSGSALAVYFIAFADESLARELDAALGKNAFRSFAGFGAIREYPVGVRGGHGDIDSGPVFLGVSPAATGFGLAGPRLFGDRTRFTALYRTAYLFGAPCKRGDRWSYLLGDGLGDAILLAMMTADPESVLP